MNKRMKKMHKIDKDTIQKIVGMPVIVGISEFTDYARGKVNELHVGRITQCFPFYEGQLLKSYRCEIIIDESIIAGNFIGQRLIVSERHYKGYPDVLLQGESWIVYVSMLQDGAEVPDELTLKTSEMLYLGFGSVEPPNKWNELIESINRNLKYMTNKERIASNKIIFKISNYRQNCKF